MAVLQTLRNWLVPERFADVEIIVPAPRTTYTIRPLTAKDVNAVLQLNLRCFRNGENYNKHTFSYLLNEPKTLSYQIVTAGGEMAGFVFVMMNPDGTAHITTIGVAPEHRRRGLAARLMTHVEKLLAAKGVSTIVLEVRVSNVAAQNLYREAGYATVQRVTSYYHNGEDGFLMVKPLAR